jgi:hypothetical protein
MTSHCLHPVSACSKRPVVTGCFQRVEGAQPDGRRRPLAQIQAVAACEVMCRLDQAGRDIRRWVDEPSRDRPRWIVDPASSQSSVRRDPIRTVDLLLLRAARCLQDPATELEVVGRATEPAFGRLVVTEAQQSHARAAFRFKTPHQALKQTWQLRHSLRAFGLLALTVRRYALRCGFHRFARDAVSVGHFGGSVSVRRCS